MTFYFQQLITQGRLSELQAKESNIRRNFISIQFMLLPHMEIMKHELSLAKALMKIDANLSTEEGLVDLATTLEIQTKILEDTIGNWELILAMI